MHKHPQGEKYNCVSELIDYGFKIVRKLVIKYISDHFTSFSQLKIIFQKGKV